MSKPTIQELEQKIQALQAQLQASNDAFFNAVGKSSDGVLILLNNGSIAYANEAALKLMGKQLGEVLGEDFGIPAIKQGPSKLQFLHKNGSKLTVEVKLSAIEWEGQQAFLASLRNIKHRQHITATENSLYDPLTQLANKAHFERNFDKALARAQQSNSKLALLYMDIDNFRAINDSLGHEAGDQLLIAISQFLKKHCRPSDTLAHLSGDEFILLLDPINQAADAALLAKQILTITEQALQVNQQDFFVQLSIGIAVYPFAGKTRSELFDHADTAMYQAKRNGKNCYQYFTKELDQQAQYYLKLHTLMHQALAKHEFEVRYQTQICLKTSAIAGVEASLHWHNSELGHIPRSQFIPLARKSGLITKLDDYLLQQASADLVDFTDFTGKVSISISKRSCLRQDLVEAVLNNLERNQFPAERLLLQLHELAFSQDSALMKTHLRQLNELGVSSCLTDYGAEFSAQRILGLFNFQQVKIQAEDEQLASQTIQQAKALNIEVIANGVESLKQLIFAKKQGCDLAQGNYLAKAMPIQQLQHFVAAWQEDTSDID